jgi:hypothetical protein
MLAAAGITLIHIKPVSSTLEDVFIQLLEMESDAYQPIAHS